MAEVIRRSLKTTKRKSGMPKRFYAYVLYDAGNKYPHEVYTSWIEARAHKKKMPGIHMQKILCKPVGKSEREPW